MNGKNDSRYPPSPPMMMQRPYPPDRRRSLSPGPPGPYPAYDRYIPPRTSDPRRDPYANSYRPEPWQADRPYAGNTPSPDRYRPPRHIDGDGWGRPAWRPLEQPEWIDRRPPPPPPPESYDPVWGRQRRDIMAQSMLEPSDTWKQSHAGGPDVQEGSMKDWLYDRYAGEPVRMRDRSPERVPERDPYFPNYPPNDRYRRFSGPIDQRDPHPYGPRSDSYRPQYEERGPWNPSSYHPGGMDVRNREVRPALREARFAPRPEFGERMRFSRERSVGGGSVHTSPLPSPIRTRTNLPDRVQFGHSRSNSGSYPHSPLTKSHPRQPWDFEPPPQMSPRPRSRSMSQDMTYPMQRRSDNGYDFGPSTAGRRSPPSPAARRQTLTSRSPSRSPVRTNRDASPMRQHGAVTPPRDFSGYGSQIQSPQLRRHDLTAELETHTRDSTSSSRSTVDINSHPVFHSESRHSQCSFDATNSAPAARRDGIVSSADHVPMTVDESPAPTVPAHAPARPAMTTSELADNLSKISTEDVSGSIPQRPDDNRSGALQSARAESSPEPDIPLSARTKQGATGRSSTSAPATPVPDQSVPPSRDEPPPHPQKFLAPNIQKTIEPMPLHDALRAVVMLRLQCDRQTQEERVTPILLDNLSKTEPPMPSVATPEDVIREVTTGERKKAREEVFGGTRESLQVRFAKRQEDLAVKVAHLREEYLGLHKQWLVHCNKLDDVAKAIALQEAAATAGRTTRRSLATMGDAVRSDLEMEQIIASLGNEEMTDANHLGAKNAAVIPDMISVTRGAVDYLFDDTNNEVEDPATYYAPTTGIDDWTEDEVTVFLDKFAETPKQFGIIADALPNKTPAQCVTFYYLHKNKHIDFRQVVARRAQKRKRGGRKQKSNALLADIRKRDDEVSAAAPARRRRAPAGSSSTAEPRRGSGRRGAAAVQAEDTPDGTPTPEPDNEPRKRRRRVAARATVAEQEEGAEDAEAEPKPAKRTRKPRRQANTAGTPLATTPITATPLETPALPNMPEVDPMDSFAAASKFSDQAGPSMQRKPSGSNSGWSIDDKNLFLQLLAQHGDDFKRIAASMPNKTTIQVGAFYRSHADEMGLDRIVASAPKRSPSPPGRQGIWRQATFSGPSVSFQNMRAPTENYHQALSRSQSGGSTPTSAPTPSGSTGFQFRPSAYETVQMPYGASRSQSGGSEDTSQGSVPSMHVHPSEHINNPSPFATGPITTRFSSFPYRNFSPSHFTDNPSPSFSGYQPAYAANARAHEAEPHVTRTTMASMSNSGMAFDTAPPFVPAPQTWAHAPLQSADDLAAYLEHRTRLSQQQ